jgi:hypothetical protein
VPSAKANAAASRWWPLVALLVAGSVRAVVADAHPEAGTTAASMALGCLWAAGMLLLLPLRGEAVPPASAWRALLAGAMLLPGPLLPVLLLGTAPVDSGGLTMALALTSVVVAVASAAMSGEGEDVAGRLWPGLAAVGGLLLVLVTPALNDARADAAMVLAPVLAGVGAVWFAQQHGGAVWRTRLALVGGAIVFSLAACAGWGMLGRPAVSLAAVAWDGVIAGLGVMSLARLGAVRWSAQFVLLPLLVLALGLVVVRPALDWRMVLGLGLLAVAGGYLLWLPE